MLKDIATLLFYITIGTTIALIAIFVLEDK